jgi:hypothetical protein
MSFSIERNKNGLAGTYSIGEFEFWSIITLNQNHTFEYKYGVGGCQATITGKWTEEYGMLKLTNDLEYSPKAKTDVMAPSYPNLNNVLWKEKADGLKPLKEIDTGCFKTKKLHKRIKK